MKIIKIYHQLLERYGPQGWWPVNFRRGSEVALFEICLGAILTQNTAWTNVEKALNSLIKHGLLSPKAIHKIKPATLGRIIKSSGYWRQKTKKLKIFSQFVINNYGGSFKKMLGAPTAKLRLELLSLWGFGPETVDSILLYAGAKPVFVIDVYTKRLCQKYGVRFQTYDEYQIFFTKQLAKLKNRAKVYNEFHALIVRWGKE